MNVRPVAARLHGDDREVEVRRVLATREELDVPDAVPFAGPDDDRTLGAHSGAILLAIVASTFES